MSTEDTLHAEQDVGQPDARHAHPSDGTYIKVAIFLAVITAIEVGLYYWDLGETLNNPTLLILSGIKFVAVVGFFMHLRFDNRILRRLFTTGFILAILVYIAYMLTLGVFID